MKKLITNLCKVFKPSSHFNELFGKNDWNFIDRFEIRRDDNQRFNQIRIEIFSQTKPKASGAPSMLLLSLEDAQEFHDELGRVLDPTKKDLENVQN